MTKEDMKEKRKINLKECISELCDMEIKEKLFDSDIHKWNKMILNLKVN